MRRAKLRDCMGIICSKSNFRFEFLAKGPKVSIPIIHVFCYQVFSIGFEVGGCKSESVLRGKVRIHDQNYIIFAVPAFECLGGKSSVSVLIWAKVPCYVYRRGKARCIKDFISEYISFSYYKTQFPLICLRSSWKVPHKKGGMHR